MEIITSRRNPGLKEIRELKKRAARETLGLTFIEGQRLVGEAFSASPQVGIKAVYVSESYARGGSFTRTEKAASERDIRLFMLPDGVFADISDTMNPQGLLAVIETRYRTLEELARRGARRRLVLILDRVSDPGNAGAMLRTAGAAAFTGAILSEGCVDAYSPKVLRASMGAVFRVPVMRGAGAGESAAGLKRMGFTVYASSAARGGRELDCFRAELGEGDAALIIGSEAAGIGEAALGLCDGVLTIPMDAGTESLNAGVAAGILMYEFYRRERYGAR